MPSIVLLAPPCTSLHLLAPPCTSAPCPKIHHGVFALVFAPILQLRKYKYGPNSALKRHCGGLVGYKTICQPQSVSTETLSGRGMSGRVWGGLKEPVCVPDCAWQTDVSGHVKHLEIDANNGY
ncbi:hypothetical protein B0I72DRAFT_44984 [Yarrowia lipolytica]|uniref:Uncharacterized protein n=1 Tax=Yarrowia lipolytica TaxID=4952 RepID=A0A371C7D2_YARLL|nr:hypothetical protein B0I71DRAFT_33324 [Yarrowia lipolytica]RDW31588.1 hypothetical protein B0I72DRAFT_44984 [Yarrowia lipolytica]RDW38526.1 hypothetical protein B0I73DRAFT_43733 [Yarrowia lipolytica]RDW44790.1 hypothetical protein B0I74DRAFT_42867 [Yarrowia lipolytica]RDW51278.1 hypothetical protein B0I75DRAFT_44519 [Yarrowia lipolytica]